MNFDTYEYFSSTEFDSPDIPGSGKQMDEIFILMLHEARIFAGIPFVIVSGFRSSTYNKKVGGVMNSTHLTGIAADIYYKDSKQCFTIIDALLHVGFNRIGINNNSIHVDFSKTKPQNVIWNYY